MQGECIVLCDLVTILQGTFMYISLDEDLATGEHQPCQLIKQGPAHHEPLLMAFLPPGIWKVNGRPLDTCVRVTSWQEQLDVSRDDAHLIEAQLLAPLIYQVRPFILDFYAEDAALGGDPGALQYRHPSPKPNIELDWAMAGEQRFEIDWPLIKARGDEVVAARWGGLSVRVHGGPIAQLALESAPGMPLH